MSDLEEVDVEQQLKKAEESGEDTSSLVLSEPDDDDIDDEDELLSGLDDGEPKEDEMGQESDIETDDDKTYNVGDFVTTLYQPEFGENQPVYKIK